MKKLLPLIFICFAFSATKQNYVDVLIRNGKVLDGTGNSWYYADVAVKDGKIEAIGKLINYNAKKIIDATGLMVTPGFIDVHTHIEEDEIKNPYATNFIYDGVTTVVTGNCGSSHTDINAYFNFIDSLKLSINVASLIGHNDVRKKVMGRANRTPTAAELDQMKAIVEQAMKDGAMGLSTGLIYIPGTYTKTDEIIELARVAAKYNGLYATHMRDEGDSVTYAINEALLVGKTCNMPVEISHFKLSGQQNWGRSKETLPLIVNARKEGIDVTIDQYPYGASSTSLSTLLPEKILADGQDSIIARLKNKATRKAAIDHMLKNLNKRKLTHFSYPVVAYYAADTSLNGKSIEQVNIIFKRKHTAINEAETVLQMMEKGGATMIFHGMGDVDIKRIMQYPFNMFASDASIRVYNSGSPHPRGYGTNARVLSKYVRDEKVITLEEAIRRMTSLPAQKFKLNNRGILRVGYAADIVVFDEKKVKDLSTYDKPHNYSKGFMWVVVNGDITVDNGTHNQTRAGITLRNNQQ